jgi:hypothetical protein
MENKEIYAAWIKAKKAERKAKDKRIEIEKQIELTLPEFKEKSKILHENGFKITVKRNESYSFSNDWKTVRENIPTELRPEKITYKPIEKGLEYLKEHEPEIYKTISDHVVYKPGKTGYTVEKETK